MSDATSGTDVVGLLARVRGGDRSALNELLAAHRDAIGRFLELRMDPKLRARVGVSDVLQEADLEIARRIDDFLAREPMPFQVWVLKTAHQQLLRLRRHHVEAECRGAGAEVPLPDNASVLLAGRLAAASPTPSQEANRAETARLVQAALAELPELDREVILLRTFEGLSNAEAAQFLDIDPPAASKRYTRALLKLREALASASHAS
jgi:RNA polymerase sigma-70 factor (ECF subfamily)